MKRHTTLFVLTLCVLLVSASAIAQLSGTKTIPGDYATLAAAIADLNTQGVGSGGVTFNVSAGYTETLSAPLVLTATGTAADPIIFQKSGVGANPLITAYVGTQTPGTATHDDMWRLVGSDYVTIDGIDLYDPNTTNPATMEGGYVFYKASASNGAQNNTIKNCVITLNRVNNASGSGPSVEGSRGIEVTNATPTAATTALTPTDANGTNSNNRFYSNTIQNCNYGIVLSGYAAASPFTLGDTGNDIGGSSPATGNTILNFGGAPSATNPAAGIRANNQWSVNISYNTINNNDGSGVNHVSTLRGIFAQAGTSANATINNNTITIHGGGTTSQVSGIENGIGSTAAGNTVEIAYNDITGSYLTATSGNFYLLYNTASPATVFIHDNSVHDLNYSATALGGSGQVYGIYSSGAATTVNIRSNTVRDIYRTGTTGGTTIGIYTSSGTNQTVKLNSVYNFGQDGTGSGSTMYGIQTSTGTIVCDSNVVHDLTVVKTSGTGSLYGIYNIASPTNENYNYNQVYTLTHNGTGTVYGIYAFTTTGVRTTSNNLVYSVVGAGTTVAGINQASSSPTIFNNKIYDIRSTSTGAPTVSGLILGSLGTSGVANVYNNLIGDIKAPNASSSGPTSPTVRGINITTTTTSTTVSVSYNTVYLNASSTGANFSTAALYVTSSATATTAALTLRNNVFVNTSTPAGTGLTVAYQRSSTDLANYTSASNNNDFYAGTTGPANLIFYDGTNADQTIAAFKARVSPREGASFTENPAFLSTSGSSPNFLHIDPSIPTQLESGGQPIAGITTDYDGDLRNATTPDIGADEFAGTPLDLSPPSISYALLSNTSGTSNRSFTGVTITDPSGVDGNPGTRPRVYYRRTFDANTFNDNTSGTDGWKYAEASGSTSPFDFTINYSLLFGGSGVTAGDTVQYFVVAQDLAPTPNVGINSGTFSTQPSSVNLTAAAFPITGAINGYRILGTISGVKTIGASGADYPSLTAAVADLNSKELNGPLTLLLNADYSSAGETFPITINANSGSSATNTVTIKPNVGVTASITGSSSTAIIVLNGADYITIDGSNGALSPAATTDLTITNTNTSSGTAAIWLSSAGTGAGAMNNTIKNCNIACGADQSTGTNTTFGIISSGTSISTTSDGADNDNNTFMNNTIVRVRYGIYLRGASGNLNDNNTIERNVIGPTAFGSDEIGKAGIILQYQNAAVVSQNEVRYVGGTYATTSAGSDRVGIGIGSDSWTPTAATVTNTSVARNLVHDIVDARTFSAVGIVLAGSGAPSSNTVANNMIYNILANGTVGDQAVGIGIGAGDGDRVVFNSIHMEGNIDGLGGASTATQSGAGVRISSTTPANLMLKNNIMSVDLTSTTTTINHYDIVAPSTAYAWGTGGSDYNDYYFNPANTQMKLGGIGTSVPYTAVADLATWQTQFTPAQDANSIDGNPGFISATNLHVDSSAVSPVDSAGTPIAGITTDFDGNTRDAVMPDIGADEFTYVPPILPPNCAVNVSPPDAATNVPISAVLVWASGGGGPTGYKIYFGTDNPPTNIENGTDLGLVTTYDPAGNMAYSTTYYWKIVPYNTSGDATGCPVWSFTTEPDPTVYSFPYAEGFESTTFPPTNWTSTILSGTYNWARVTSGINPTQLPYSGVGEAMYQSYNASAGSHARLVTPPLSFTSSTMRVNFFMYHDPGYSTNYDSITVEITTDNGTSWTTLANFQRYAPTAGWQNHIVPLTGYTGIVKVGFHAWSRYGNNMFIDSVRIEETPAGPPDCAGLVSPGNGATGVPITATLNWSAPTGGGPLTGYNLYFGTSSPPPFVGDLGNVLTYDPPGNLAYSTVYYWKVEPYGPGGPAVGCPVWSFTTGPDPTITIFPHTENFDGVTAPALPYGWTIENTNSDAYTWMTSTSAPRSAPNSMYIRYNASLAMDDWFFTPPIQMTGGTSYLVKFWYRAQSATYPEAMEVKWGTSPSSGGMTQGPIFSNTNIANTTYAQGSGVITPASSGTYYIGFHGMSAVDMWNLYVDDFTIQVVYNNDYAVTSVVQLNGIPTPYRPFELTMRNRTMELQLDARSINRHDGSAINTSRILAPGTFEVLSRGLSAMLPLADGFSPDHLLATSPITIRTIVANNGLNSAAYTLEWNVDGVPGTEARPAIASFGTDTVVVTMTPANRGTVTSTSTANLTGEENPSDNTGQFFYTLVYPDTMVRQRWDNGTNLPNYFIGFGTPTPAITAAVRFTATDNIQIANVDAYYRNETSTDSVEVQVRAAGPDTLTPGALLYSKKFAGQNYINSSGMYFTFPLGNDAPAFNAGSDYWLCIQFPEGPLYPMGAHGPGAPTGYRSVGSADSGATWFPLVISGQPYAWLLRSVGVPVSTQVTVNVPVAQSWNILSLPVADPTGGDSVRQVYTNSQFPYGFTFSGGYNQTYVMENGPGMWIKSMMAYTEDIIGTPLTSLAIPVAAGWNMIGSRTTASDTGCVVWGGGAYRASAFFAYSGGYVVTSSLAPGAGFWVKSGAAGTITLQDCPLGKSQPVVAGRSVEELNSLTIRDASGGSQTLYFGTDANGEIPVDMYAMPPVPPEGSFDARFESVDGGSMVQTHGAEVTEAIELPITIQSSSYPLTVTWKVNGSATVYELRAGEEVVQTLSGEGTLRIGNDAVNRLTLRVTGSGSGLPKEYALWQNYPNPFNPVTTIRFALPVESKVSAEIYNILGQRVATLVNEVLPAGYHTVEWNGTGSTGQALGSGVYFLKVAAKGANGKDFTDVKKLMMVK